MNISPSLQKLIDQIKKAVLPAPELVQLDEDHLSRQRSARDLFDQLIDSDNEETGLPQGYISRRSSMRPESPRDDGSAMQVEVQGGQHTGCKCSKIGCLKLYCQCFAKGRLCGSRCICSCCGNHAGNHAGIYHAKKIANYRNPGHFQGVPAHVPGRKCTCKKSSCRKNYCECYRAGVPCGEGCECLDCRNGKPHQHDDHMGAFGMQLQLGQIEVSAFA